MDRTIGDRLNRRVGLLDDERRRQAQGLAARNAYLTVLGLALLASLYQTANGWPSAPLWPVNLSIILSLVVLIVRRVSLVGIGLADERTRWLRARIFRGAYMVLVIGLFLYSSYLFWGRGDTPAMMLWSGCYLLSLPVIWLSHLLHDTAQGRPWLWLILTVLMLGSIMPGAALLITALAHDMRQDQSLPTFRSMIPIFFYFVPLLLFVVAAVGAAWRSWRAERGADE
ncbi:MAG: hypothetical protein MI924_02875 [Chloroflexales bacterium]|nr:hypothetical protein [Chloroflexales bacterium]